MSERGDRFISHEEHAWRDRVRAFPFVNVGASVLQTPGSIQSEINKVDGEIGAFDLELAAVAQQHGVVTTADWSTGIVESYAGKDPIARFFVDAWVPFRKAWHGWKAGNDSWWHNLWTNEAPNAEAFQRKLTGYREAARRLSIPVHSPEPDIEGMSIADPRRKSPVDYAGEAADTAMKVAKYGLYGALGLGAVFGVVEIVKAARSK